MNDLLLPANKGITRDAAFTKVGAKIVGHHCLERRIFWKAWKGQACLCFIKRQMAERNYVSWKVLKSLTQSPHSTTMAYPSLQLAYSTASFMTPFGFIKTFCHWFLYYLPFLFVPRLPLILSSLSSSTVLGLISAIFLIICLLSFLISLHSPRQKSQPQMNHSLPFSMYHSLNSVPPKIHVEILNPSTLELWLYFKKHL